MRKQFILFAVGSAGLILAASYLHSLQWLWLFVVVLPLIVIGLADMLQTRRAIRRNFPLLGHGRYLMEMIRPEINQYFVESDTDGAPFNREQRSVVYQRAKGELDTLPFGTQRDVYGVGYEWINHSMAPKHHLVPPRIRVGGPSCQKPYDASPLNVSAMSYGALSKPAVEALNLGAKMGGFAHNTGEGSISPYHEKGGDLIWQIGTGYFGCRTEDGRFDPGLFESRAQLPAVKMIELKLSQGAKPGHGGILPAAKITPEIARLRVVPMGRDVLSPPAHTAFSTPIGLLEFIARLRELSGGKPVGFKFCVGHRKEFLAVCKAMVETDILPDYIAVDGGEGGTGAAPLEFSNRIGCPLTEGLTFVHNALVGIDVRSKVRVFASGKVITGFDMARLMALGADVCYSARGMMMALGCIQARRCNHNNCPTGIATQRPELTVGLVVGQKKNRVAQYHKATVTSLMELVGAAGLEAPADLRPWHIVRRVHSHEISHYGELFDWLEPGALLAKSVPESFARAWDAADARDFRRTGATADVHA